MEQRTGPNFYGKHNRKGFRKGIPGGFKMSLIMDALKKAQQLQLKGSERSPILKVPHPDQKRGKGSKKQWIPVGAGLVFLCIVLFILIKPGPAPFAIQPYRAIIPMKRIHSEAMPKKEEPTEGLPYVGAALSDRPSPVPVVEKISTEPPKQVSSLPKDEKPILTGQALNRVGSGKEDTEGSSSIEAALKDQAFPKSKPPLYKKGRESLIKQGPERERLEVQGKVIVEKSLPPSPASQKEESPPKPIGVEQEGGKDRSLTSDILNYFNSGVHFYKQREFSKAIQAYQKVIELDPTYIEAYNNLGIVYQLLGDEDKAVGFYQKSTEINPRYEKGYNNLGILLLLKGRYEEAQEVFQKALAINSNNIESHMNLGILLKKKGELEKAIGSYQNALAINPLHGETHYNIALLYEQLGNLELAISHYQQFIQSSLKSHQELVSKVQRHLNYLEEVRRNKGK
jgi:tetratricopeptide (TPR) repeat protein